MNKNKEPKTAFEALTLALVLSVTAPTEEKGQQCLKIAQSIARNLSPEEVKRAQKEAERILGISI